MDKEKIDLKKEQQASNARPGKKHTLIEKFFFLTMDMMTGRATTLSKQNSLRCWLVFHIAPGRYDSMHV